MPYLTTRRASAARERNYNNCDMCKRHRQKCQPASDGQKCKRCTENKYPCSLALPSLSEPVPVVRRQLREQDMRRFGQILYIFPSKVGEGEQVLHLKYADGWNYVYLTDCDEDFNPVSPSKNLGTCEEILGSIYSLTIDDLPWPEHGETDM